MYDSTATAKGLLQLVAPLLQTYLEQRGVGLVVDVLEPAQARRIRQQLPLVALGRAHPCGRFVAQVDQRIVQVPRQRAGQLPKSKSKISFHFTCFKSTSK